jgi:hypothetical protein
MVARTSPLLAGSGRIAGRAGSWGVVWADLKAAGSVGAASTIKLPE